MRGRRCSCVAATVSPPPERVAILCVLMATFLNACRFRNLAASVALLGFVVLLVRNDDGHRCETAAAWPRRRQPEPFDEPDTSPPPEEDADQAPAPVATGGQPIPLPESVDDESYALGLVVGQHHGPRPRSLGHRTGSSRQTTRLPSVCRSAREAALRGGGRGAGHTRSRSPARSRCPSSSDTRPGPTRVVPQAFTNGGYRSTTGQMSRFSYLG
jgi:hypothetical protein